MPMSRKQAEGLVKNVKDPELLRAWKKKLGEGSSEEEISTDPEGEGSQTIANMNAHDEGW